MKKVLDSSRPEHFMALDGLYMIVLKQSLEGIEAEGESGLDWRRVVGTIATVWTPLTVKDMDALLGLPTESLYSTWDYISPLQPLLKDGARRDKVQLLHKTVFDFLRTQTIIPIDFPVRHQELAGDCLAYMNENLRYDMSWISSSEPSSEFNTSAVRYACRSFSKHLSESILGHPSSRNEPRIGLTDTRELRIFLTEHLLHWFEAMARLKENYEAERSLNLLSTCLTVSLGIRRQLQFADITKGSSSSTPEAGIENDTEV